MIKVGYTGCRSEAGQGLKDCPPNLGHTRPAIADKELMSATLKQRLASIPPLVWLLLLTLACLVPFAGKAFFIDDTLFIRAAEQIQKHPADFYGFNINWYGYSTPMTVAFDNPPLTSYYIALVALLLGWSEWALHLAFLLPALAAVWGIFALAKNYCDRPFTAALIALLSPVFLISATAVMCDVMQLAFWVWTLVFFEKGLRSESRAALVTSGIMAGLALLTKYLALSLVPLLLAYGFCRMRRPGWWLLAPIIPLFFAAGYQWLTFRLYGHGLVLNAAHEASRFRANAYDIRWEQVTVGISFVGACFLPVLFYAPWLWSRRIILAMPCLIAAGLLIIPRMAVYVSLMWKPDGRLQWGTFSYTAILVIAGLYVFLLAAMDLWERRDAVSVLLLLWLSGMFVFTVALNWTINGRSLLPAVPAIGILAARRLERRKAGFAPGEMRLLWPALPAGIITLILVKADYNLANVQCTAAKTLSAQYRSSGHELWFQMHWGFQYYAEQLGAKALEVRSPHVKPGDVLIRPFDGRDRQQNHISLGSYSDVPLIGEGKYVANTFCATMSPSAGAGFYAANLGPLPFVIGDIKPEYFDIYQVSSKAPVPGRKPLASKD